MVSIRPETAGDVDSIRHVNEQAFGQTDEATIVDKLRDRNVLTVSLIAAKDNEVVGHIAFSPVLVESQCSSFEAVALAPMAILPPYQRKGIGSQLVRAGLEECRRLGHDIVVLIGHPGYYPRFGFVPAKQKGIDCEFEVPDEAWMVLELKEGILRGRSGTVKFQPEFKEVA
ncbi:GNAT family N-acetyltransferase [Chloroflexota bacterium]